MTSDALSNQPRCNKGWELILFLVAQQSTKIASCDGPDPQSTPKLRQRLSLRGATSLAMPCHMARNYTAAHVYFTEVIPLTQRDIEQEYADGSEVMI